MKIGICGKMCSGKSTLAKQIKDYINSENKDIQIDAFANKIYEIAYALFNMKEKDRKLLQSIGTKFREIDENVWVNYIINKYNSTENINDVIIDDVRYKNELDALKENGYILIKLNISEELQIQRLKELYKDSFQIHYDNMNHSSENELNLVSNDLFDIIIDVDKFHPFEIIKTKLLF